MGLELGKWLLDIAKYMITAFLLANVFGDMNSVQAIVEVVLAVAVSLGVGLYLIRKSNKENNKRKGK